MLEQSIVEPIYKKRDFKYYGHNYLENGQWWPRLQVTSRDGAHGAPIAGISGEARGTFSIVVAMTYTDDVDNGDEIFYSDTVGKEPLYRTTKESGFLQVGVT